MDVWIIVLYGFASVLALRSLIGLMHHHRNVFQKKVLIREREAIVEESMSKAFGRDSEEAEEQVAA